MINIYNKKSIILFVIIITFIFYQPIYNSIFHFINYNELLGLDKDVYGYPRKVEEVIFNFGLSILFIISCLAILILNKWGLVLAKSLILFAIVFLILEELSLTNRYIEYFNSSHFFYIIILLVSYIFLNNKNIKLLFEIKYNYFYLQIILFVMLFILGIFSNSR